MMMQKEREDIVRVGRLLYERGLVQWCGGNISIRDPETGHVAIKASGRAYMDAIPEDVIIVDLDGNVLEGTNKPSIETPMHTSIYKARPDINAIVHCHPPYAIAWSLKGHKYVHAMLTAQYLTKGPVMVAPYADAGTTDLAKYAVEGIGNDYATILKSHGVICGSPRDVFSAFDMCLVVEDACKIACICETMPGDTAYIDVELGNEGGYDGLARIREADAKG